MYSDCIALMKPDKNPIFMEMDDKQDSRFIVDVSIKFD